MKVVRRSDREVVNLSIPKEARAILNELAGPTGRGHGEIVGRLLFEHRAREEARAQALREVAEGKK